MQRVKKKTFKQEVIVLDNNAFSDCAFIQCHLVYLGATEVSLVRCNFTDCTWAFDGPAARVIRFMGFLYAMGEQGAELIEKTFTNIRANEFPLDPKQT